MPSDLITTTIPAKYSFLQNLDVGLDIIIVSLWVTTALVYAFTVGRKKGPILLLSTYAGLAVSGIMANLKLSPAGSLSKFQDGDFFSFLVFGVVFLVAFVSLIRIIKRHIRIHSNKHGVMVLAALEMGGFLSSVGSLLPADLLKQVSGFATLMFATPWMHALWLTVPLLIILIGEHNDRYTRPLDDN
ncbi:MAG: hypothetical protein A3J48_04650 [Candidatus Doudnabacteria bacterium RIFCSPHIGHO2_02_FULL_46_11]|uniref:Uncharacterized protein n=1 Tax=Candidatus Doudnabacteria bacterium RIFCSPHIGHO2_02_FULL_46_11 TaxID=1817832 RepID=A0A1F5P6L5_9BACT|nr:MAG: hypothetical protein A3J48_04650 [Candidatus Doudnabacteria bacterium RIFCSPHIGHO2_02_FULL_46_11]